MPEWDGLLPPVSCGERPIIDGVRTPVAYSIGLIATFQTSVAGVHVKWGPPNLGTLVPIFLVIWGPQAPISLGIWGPVVPRTLVIWGSLSDLGT